MAMGAPQQVEMGGGGEDIFNGAKKVMVKQEFAALEMCSCEAKNRYRVSQPDGEDEGQNIFLYIDEDSGCVERICCSVNRSLTLNVHKGSDKTGPIVQAMHKPLHIQGCCCCRANFDVWDGAIGTTKLGHVDDPFALCSMNQQVLDSSDTKLFTTSGSICQCGMCCPFCASVDFTVKKDDKDVAYISKRPMTIWECCAKTNRFTIDFGELSSPKEKKMLLASAMLLDLEYFEQNKKN